MVKHLLLFMIVLSSPIYLQAHKTAHSSRQHHQASARSSATSMHNVQKTTPTKYIHSTSHIPEKNRELYPSHALTTGMLLIIMMIENLKNDLVNANIRLSDAYRWPHERDKIDALKEDVQRIRAKINEWEDMKRDQEWDELLYPLFEPLTNSTP